MKIIKYGMLIVILLASASVLADPSNPSATTTVPQPPAAQPATVMPCDRTQPNCPMTSQPMGRGNSAGMPQDMHQGMMGPGNPGYQGHPKNMPPASDKAVVYGSQLMTPEERTAYRAKLSAAKTDAERTAIRAQHHQEMQVRAKKLGKTLPPAPPPF